MTAVPTVGYFSMEIAITATMPLYGGGLGVLAGDTLRSAADLQGPMLARSRCSTGKAISISGSTAKAYLGQTTASRPDVIAGVARL